LKQCLNLLICLKVVKKNIGIIITRCERKSPLEKEKLVKQFSQHPDLKRLLEIVNPKILFSGSMVESDYEKGDVDGIRDTYQATQKMRCDVYDHIFDSDKFVNIKELEFYKKEQASIPELIKEKESLINDLTNIKITAENAHKYKLEVDQITHELQTMQSFIREGQHLDEFVRMKKILEKKGKEVYDELKEDKNKGNRKKKKEKTKT